MCQVVSPVSTARSRAVRDKIAVRCVDTTRRGKTAVRVCFADKLSALVCAGRTQVCVRSYLATTDTAWLKNPRISPSRLTVTVSPECIWPVAIRLDKGTTTCRSIVRFSPRAPKRASMPSSSRNSIALFDHRNTNGTVFAARMRRCTACISRSAITT